MRMVPLRMARMALLVSWATCSAACTSSSPTCNMGQVLL